MVRFRRKACCFLILKLEFPKIMLTKRSAGSNPVRGLIWIKSNISFVIQCADLHINDLSKGPTHN